jgi:pyroglutamyl-peptidase
MRLHVFGFEPFGKHDVNPSQLVVEEIGGTVLPVSYARAADMLRETLSETAYPEVVICLGLADERTVISVERFAHNLDEASTIDNEDAAGSGAEIEPGAPLALASTLPVDEIVSALQAQGLPAEVSRDAGGFLCNHVFYVLMRSLRETQVGGFVHVPPLDVLPLERLLEAARVIVATCALHTSSS